MLFQGLIEPGKFFLDICGKGERRYKERIKSKETEGFYLPRLEYTLRNSLQICEFHMDHPGAPEPGGQGGQLPTQLLDPYVLSHATSFLSLFSACPPRFKLLPKPMYIGI